MSPSADGASAFLAQHGVGPILAIIGQSNDPTGWTDELIRRHPTLTLDEADRLIAFGLRARGAWLTDIPGPLAPTEPEPDGSAPPATAALRYRYRVRIRFGPPRRGRYNYRAGEVTSDVPLDPGELEFAVGLEADEMVGDGGAAYSGFEYDGFDLLSTTRYPI